MFFAINDFRNPYILEQNTYKKFVQEKIKKYNSWLLHSVHVHICVCARTRVCACICVYMRARTYLELQ